MLPSDDEVRRKSKAHRRRSVIAGVISVLVLCLFAGAVVIGGQKVVGRLGGPADYEGAGTGRVDVVVPDDATAGKIGQILEDEGVVRSARAFTRASRENPASLGIQPGPYQLRRTMSAVAALELLLDPRSRRNSSVSIPEGYTTREIFARVSSKTKISLRDLQAAAKDSKAIGLPRYAGGKVEGFLFPATYQVAAGTSATDVLAMMVEKFTEVAASVDLEAEAAKVGLQPLEVVTLASMIEEETAVDTERAKVSRVIHNRLDNGMPLQIDATIQYLLPKARRTLHTKDLRIDSPYNTYAHTGLPPGPIASPRKASLRAALRPAVGKWIYYLVADPKTGRHTFTASYAEFVNLKKKTKQDAQG